MTEPKFEKLYGIAFGFNVKQCHHARKEFNEYINKYFPELTELLKEFWKKQFIYVNGWGEIQVSYKLLKELEKQRLTSS